MNQSVLYIDDNEFEHYLVESLLKSYSSHNAVKCLFNGEEALEYLKENKFDLTVIPDLILVDLCMPDFSGWDFLDGFHKIMSTLCKQPKVCILSSSINMNEVERSKSYSFVECFLIKPLTPLMIANLDT